MLKAAILLGFRLILQNYSRYYLLQLSLEWVGVFAMLKFPKIASLKLFSIARPISVALISTSFALSGASAMAQATQANPQSLPDGVYLYGQSQQPEELGKGYFVFEAKQGKVMGALYMPQSSFDCATGSFKDDKLALNVTNSYDRTTNAFDIPLERTATVAFSATNPPIREIGLEGFHRLEKVSENDHRILNVCKADLQP